jgi:hypothetical protein
VENLLSRMSSNDLAVVIFFTIVCLTGIIGFMGTLWFKHRRTEMEIALKQDMLNRGMSAEDIERVMRASKDCEISNKASAGEGVLSAGPSV